MNLAKHKVNPRVLTEVINSERTNRGGYLTFRSNKTLKDYTYKIARSNYKGNWMTHIWVETGYLKFTHIGTYRDGAITKHKAKVETPTALGMTWLLSRVQEGAWEKIETQATLFHLGKCLKCGKTLTDAESIEIGLGPICNHTK